MRRAKYPEGAREMLLALGALRAGAITFNEFERRTRRDWDRIARELHGRWTLPLAVSVEDVRQELLLAIVVRKASSRGLNLLEKWRPGRRTGLDEYVVWNARVAAARWIHKQRGASRNREEGDVAGKVKSKFFPVLSTIGTVSDRSDTLPEVPVDCVQEDRLVLQERLRARVQESESSTRSLTSAQAALRTALRDARSSAVSRAALRAELREVSRRLKEPRKIIEAAHELLSAQEDLARGVREKVEALAGRSERRTGMEKLREQPVTN